MSIRPSRQTTATVDANEPNHRPRQIALVMVLVAASLAVASTLHLSGAVGTGPKPFDPSDAGIAEAVIAAVLVAGAAALWRGPHRGRPFPLGGTAVSGRGLLV